MRLGFLSHNAINLYLFRLPVMAELARRGHDVFAFAPEGRETDEFARFGVTAVTFPMQRGSLNPVGAIGSIAALVTALNPLQLDVLHSFMARSNLYAALALKRTGIPRLICSVTGLGSYFIDDGFKSRGVRALIRGCMRFSFGRAEKVLFQNRDDLREFVAMNLVDEKKTVLIKGSGIDTDLWRPAQNERHGPIKVIMVARTLKHKGVLEYVKAAKILKHDFPNVEFLFAGGPDPANFSNIPADFFPANPHVTWLGERDDIRELMQHGDIFILPSYREGMPRTVIEAQSCGLPVITTDVPGCRDSIAPDVTGFLVPPRDAGALAVAVAQLLANANLRRDMGKAAREFAVREFDVNGIVKNHLGIYGIA